MTMTTYTYSELLEKNEIRIESTFYFQSASKIGFHELARCGFEGFGDLIIKGRKNEKTNKGELQFFFKLYEPSKYNKEKFRCEVKDGEEGEYRIFDIDFFNGDSIVSNVINDFDFTKPLKTGKLSPML